jgi:hypothetical protein
MPEDPGDVYIMDGFCDERCQKRETGCWGVRDVVRKAYGHEFDKDWDDKRCQGALAKMLFKSTRCGIAISFWNDADTITKEEISLGTELTAGIFVSGYAEGSDAELPEHRMEYPFHVDDWNAVIEQADNEGVEEWEEANLIKFAVYGVRPARKIYLGEYHANDADEAFDMARKDSPHYTDDMTDYRVQELDDGDF